MVDPLQPVFDLLRFAIGLGESFWEWIAPAPIVQDNPLISLIIAVFLIGYLKSRGSSDEREAADEIEEWTIDVLAGAWVSVFHDLPQALGSVLQGVGKGIGSGVQKIRESENFSLFGGSIIDLSLISWKTIVLGALGLLGLSAGAVFGWLNGIL